VSISILTWSTIACFSVAVQPVDARDPTAEIARFGR